MLSILALAVASKLSMSFPNSLVSCMPSATANTCLPNLAASTSKFQFPVLSPNCCWVCSLNKKNQCNQCQTKKLHQCRSIQNYPTYLIHEVNWSHPACKPSVTLSRLSSSCSSAMSKARLLCQFPQIVSTATSLTASSCEAWTHQGQPAFPARPAVHLSKCPCKSKQTFLLKF